jgi:cellulose biosynthesis protein BcsQ
MKIILVANFKGGVGKSTISNLLQERLSNSVILALDIYQDVEITNIVNDDGVCNTKLLKKGFEIDLQEYVDLGVEHIIIDMPGYMDERVLKIMRYVDLIVLPMTLGFRSTNTTALTIEELHKHNNTCKKLAVVNMHKSDKEYEECRDELEALLDGRIEVLYTQIRLSKAIKTIEKRQVGINVLVSEVGGHVYKPILKKFENLASMVKKLIGE